MLTLTFEFDVLLATIAWLIKNDWSIKTLSVAVGRGLPFANSFIHPVA